MRIECGGHRLKSTCRFSTGDEECRVGASRFVAIVGAKFGSRGLQALIDCAKSNLKVVGDDLERLVKENLVQNFTFLRRQLIESCLRIASRFGKQS
jgi:hypothetical protein